MKQLGLMGISLVTAGLLLTGAGCGIKGVTIPEQEPLTGNREDLEKNIGDILPDELAVTLNLIFQHTKPGEYSNVIAQFLTTPGADIEATWFGPCLSDKSATKGKADASGKLTIDKRITCFGDYRAQGTATHNGQTATFDQTVKVK